MFTCIVTIIVVVFALVCLAYTVLRKYLLILLGIACFIAFGIGDFGEFFVFVVLEIMAIIAAIITNIDDSKFNYTQELDKQKKRNQRERKIEEEYGIIDFSEK